MSARRLALCITLAALAAAVWTLPALALTMTPDSPPPGSIVTVPNALGETYVPVSIHVDMTSCYSDAVELLEMQFASVNGLGASGPAGYRGLVKPDHVHLIEDFNSNTPTTTLIGDVMINNSRVANGEVLRWTLPGFCDDAGDPNTHDNAVATGTFRIVKGGGGAQQPPAQKPPAQKPTTPVAAAHPRPRFRITRIDSPASVRQNGPRGTAAIYWRGGPTFPVTMHDAPASCAAGMHCVTETKVVRRRANPLRWAVWFCSGNATADSTIDFRYWLTDAKGRHTQKVRQRVVCKVG